MISTEEQKLVCEKVEKEMYACKHTSPSYPLTLLSVLLRYTPEVATAALGSFGTNLRVFAEMADLDHPDLGSLVGGKLCNTEFSATACELLDHAQYAITQNHTHVLSHLPKIITKLEDYTFIGLRITDPYKNACYMVRFIKDPKIRKEMRLSKESQDMSLQSFYQNRVDSWNSISSSFYGWIRNHSPFGDDEEKLRKRIVHFEQVGLADHVSMMKCRLASFAAALKEQYYGFNRCPLSTAMIVLAKANGFVMLPNDFMSLKQKKSLSRSHRAAMSLPTIKVGKDITTCITKDVSLLEVVSNLGGTKYQPRVYVAESMPFIPERMSKLMAYLDAFPEANGKPIFDHFCVLMPSVTNAHTNCLKTDPRYYDMDSKLIASGVMTPVLLGERDGKQYFIDYWC